MLHFLFFTILKCLKLYEFFKIELGKLIYDFLNIINIFKNKNPFIQNYKNDQRLL